MPRVEAAFVSGELSYSRVRELTRVAQPSTETEWIELARTLDMRALERRVAAARAGAASQVGQAMASAQAMANKPVRTEWLTQNVVRVTFELSAETWGLLERALEGARRCDDARRGTTERGTSTGDDEMGAAKRADTAGANNTRDGRMGDGTMADADALAAVVRDALSAQHQDAGASDPGCAVVVYECERCGKSELDTGVGPLVLEPASAAALCCGKSKVHLATEGRGVKRGGPLPAALRRAVMLRDRCRCRVPGCNRRRYVRAAMHDDSLPRDGSQWPASRNRPVQAPTLNNACRQGRVQGVGLNNCFTASQKAGGYPEHIHAAKHKFAPTPLNCFR